MDFQFTKAVKERAKGRMAIYGPSGSGKTFTALRIASGLGESIAVIDTENGSASKYADSFDFSTLNLEQHDPLNYVKAIEAAEQAGFDVIVIDSLSHAWSGRGGALEQVDKASKRYKGNSYAAWGDVTPLHNALIDAIIGSKCHIIATMRAKTAYELVEEKGKNVPKKLGLAPIQRDGMEYEFDVTGLLDMEHNLIIDKTRCPALDGEVFHKAGEDVAALLAEWLADGEAPARKEAISFEEKRKQDYIERIYLLCDEIDGLAGEDQARPSRDELKSLALPELEDVGKEIRRILQDYQDDVAEEAKLEAAPA